MTRLTKALMTASAASALLSACAFTAGPTDLQPSYRLQSTTVAETVERLELYSRPDGLVLSARDEQAVAQFMRTYAASGTGPIFINRPTGHDGARGVGDTDAMLRRVMASVGLNPGMSQSGEYYPRPGDPAPVVVSYKTLRTVPQDCSSVPDLSYTAHNSVAPNFGCFASANLAAMISDPRQLIEPLPQGIPNAQRRQVIYDLYIQGEPTAAQVPERQERSSQEIQ